LNKKNLLDLHCNIVAGSANNQLKNKSIGNSLHKMGILYAPDYAANAGGLIAVADEMENLLPSKKRILAKIENVRLILENIFDESARQNKATSLIANAIAEKSFNSKKVK